MDFFWMPIVEPYALSESFSTAGRVNPNFEMPPFQYIHRSTALRAAMQSVQMAAISDADPGSSKTPPENDYKNKSDNTPSPPGASINSRIPLNLSRTDGTLKVFENFFEDGKRTLRTPSEICSLPLVPQGATNSTLNTFWNSHRLTSDTLRESPYKQLYSRLTTKSNTYTVHYRVQVLKQADAANPGRWKEGRDVVQGEYRGATTIERYVDPCDPEIPDYATEPNPRPLADFYQFRVLANRQFIP
jgi:uncharacterized protein (TIGR02600 family)